MFYTKPRELKVSDLAIWVDRNAYSPDCDDDKLFKYMYAISLAYIKKRNMLDNWADYDDCALYIASQVFMRYKIPNQVPPPSIAINTDGITDSLDKGQKFQVKSVLNYIGMVATNRISRYREKFSNQFMSSDIVSKYDYENVLHMQLSNGLEDFLRIEFSMYIEDIYSTIRWFVNRLPKKVNSCEPVNMLTSVLLTCRNLFYVPALTRKYVESDTETSAYYKLFNKKVEDCVVTYLLPDDYKPYISAIVGALRASIGSDLRCIISDYQVATDSFHEAVKHNDEMKDFYAKWSRENG